MSRGTFVFPRERDWVVMLDGQPIGRHGSRRQALNSAIVMADLMGSMQHDADVMVEDEDGCGSPGAYGHGSCCPQASRRRAA